MIEVGIKIAVRELSSHQFINQSYTDLFFSENTEKGVLDYYWPRQTT